MMVDMEVLVLALSLSSGTVLFVVMICFIFLCRSRGSASGDRTKLRSQSLGRMSMAEDGWEETQITIDRGFMTPCDENDEDIFGKRRSRGSMIHGEFHISSESDEFSVRSSSVSTIAADRYSRRKESDCFRLSEGE